MARPEIPTHILQNPDRKAAFAQMRDWMAQTLQPNSIEVEDAIASGATTIDRELGGGYAPGRITEIVEPGTSRGAQSLIHHAIAQARQQQQFVALIDAPNHFDPQSEHPSHLESLLWVRPTRATELVQACDILIRDGNFPLLLVDLRLPARARRHCIRPTAWYRLQRVCEQSRIAFVAFTPESMVPCAQVRLQLTTECKLKSFDAPDASMLPMIRCEVLKRRVLQDADSIHPGSTPARIAHAGA